MSIRSGLKLPVLNDFLTSHSVAIVASVLSLNLALLSPFSFAADQDEHRMNMAPSINASSSSADCTEMEVWDISMGMCMPLSMTGMPMQMLMLHGNAFAVGISESGPRGRRDFAAPNMFMADLGKSLGDSHYLNLDFMGTFERWTLPYNAYPELLQIGESNSQGMAFVDAQHPHSSPIMGLTLSDTIHLSEVSKNSLKLFFAPRGESTDGPVAFMHRQTGIINPDAPLGHHIGQDVGHISSTVFGASLLLGGTRIEASAFNGTEPSPDAVDLPLGNPDSFSARIIQEFSPQITAMASVARINKPEPSEPDITSLYRYSASLYAHFQDWGDWKFHNSLIFGLITHLDHASSLSSLAEEFLLEGERSRVWGRLEILQRTAGELEIPSAQNQNQGQWVESLTLGYTYIISKWPDSELGLGSSVTLDFLPSEFSSAYGNSHPSIAKIFLQLSGMKMWNF